MHGGHVPRRGFNGEKIALKDPLRGRRIWHGALGYPRTTVIKRSLKHRIHARAVAVGMGQTTDGYLWMGASDLLFLIASCRPLVYTLATIACAPIL